MAGSTRRGDFWLGVTGIATILFIGVMLFFGGPATSVAGKDVGYISGDEANVRRCPAVECESTATYHRDQQLIIIKADVTGGESHGSQRWLEVQYGDEARYVHSYFVTEKSDSQAESLELLVSAAALLVVAAMLVLTGWRRGQTWAAMKEKTANSLLAAGTFAAGLVVGIVAFLVASADGQSRAAFLSSALANVGAGLVGAAVTFVLFQVFLSRRAPSREQMVELQAQLSELRQTIEGTHAALVPALIASTGSAPKALMQCLRTQSGLSPPRLHHDLTQRARWSGGDLRTLNSSNSPVRTNKS
ncbi:hypothetical protein ACFQ68_18795 [Amycolatopsis japonica]|uniref:hypothetical protein n=1 Tax=Amycolatopsis japonica TaxID=208439 RepID=UPI003672CCDB